jgi:hypothetical protein
LDPLPRKASTFSPEALVALDPVVPGVEAKVEPGGVDDVEPNDMVKLPNQYIVKALQLLAYVSFIRK